MYYVNEITGQRRYMSNLQKILAGPHWVQEENRDQRSLR